MRLPLIADRIVKGRVYPAFATHEARPYTQAWREFGQHWPYTTPLRLQEYCVQHHASLPVFDVSHAPLELTWYPVCLGFFDFGIDYFELLSGAVKNKIHQGQCKILFYYHEGDNPQRIKTRLDLLADKNHLPQNCYVFVSANSTADKLSNFITFHDFELWYYQRNIEHQPCKIHSGQRSKQFTCLSRVHKWWRATVMADLHRHRCLQNSFWSYCQPAQGGDNDCPIEVDLISQLRHDRAKFLQGAPYFCDNLADSDRNNHSMLNQEHYTDAYCNIVLESQFDVDQSSGVFLTEKTFKPIKHGQLFFIAGAAGSLQVLRDLGYQTFDNLLDNSYDTVTDHTRRAMALRDSVQRAQANLHSLYQAAIPELIHNQQLFVSDKRPRLNTLIERIYEKSC